MADDSLDIFVRISSDTTGAKQATEAIGDLNNVIRVSPAEAAKAVAATEELEAKHRDLHGAVRQVRTEIPLLGEAMHAGMLGPITIATTLIATVVELGKHLREMNDEILKFTSDETVERMARLREATLNIAEATRKSAEEDEKWHRALVTNHEEMVQKLEAQLARVKALQEQGKQIADLNRELSEANIKHQEDLGLLTPEAGIAARAKAEIDAAKADLKGKQDALKKSQGEVDHTLKGEEITESIATARFNDFEKRTPEHNAKVEWENERKKRIAKRAGEISSIEKVLGQIKADVFHIDDSELPPALHKGGLDGLFQNEDRAAWKARLEARLNHGDKVGDKFFPSLNSVQDEDIRKGAAAAKDNAQFETEKAEAKAQAEAAHKNAENLRLQRKNIDTQAEVLAKEAEALQVRAKLVNAHSLDQLTKTPIGNLLEHAAADEMIVQHQKERRRRGLKEQVYDPTTGQWRDARRGEAPTSLNDGQQNELNSAMGGLNSLSTKDQNDILNSLHLKRTPGKDFATLVMEALTLTMGNVDKHTALLQQLIAQAKSRGANIDSLNTGH